MDKAVVKSISNSGSKLFQGDAYDLNDGIFDRLSDMQRWESFVIQLQNFPTAFHT